MECNFDANEARCKCTFEPCTHKGRCCECIDYHLRRNELPACVFPPEIEKTYDCSMARFAALCKQ